MHWLDMKHGEHKNLKAAECRLLVEKDSLVKCEYVLIKLAETAGRLRITQ